MIVQNSFQNNNKNLYIVSTPIGNLSDITFRAVEILNSSDIILAEDTRNSKILLDKYNIKTKMSSYHDFNKDNTDNLDLIFSKFDNVALISDAGTPLINDPGYEIVNYAYANKINVVSIPGVTSIISALTVSALPTDQFIFLGFVNRNKNKFIETLTKYEKLESTLIFLESPLRIKETLLVIDSLFKTKEIVLARELTKKFETIYKGTASELLELNILEKGEYVLLISGSKEDKGLEANVEELYKYYLVKGFSSKEAIKNVSKDTLISKNILYNQLKVKNN
ncbi:MAG: 16S rRNA (cytidine(1402)-2'-O)-methyltransferase [Acholeplasmatales bacterium]|jgi:16S rRNA (cytidine1402-2'-O)-methyltransferase|nr:16S rRNA (cytidine(1402)-2'-O)-methyltransferase [Acholeplasmatales bacterium]